MQMLAVVPSDEFRHPVPRQFDVLESIRWATWRVLASAEPGFDMGLPSETQGRLCDGVMPNVSSLDLTVHASSVPSSSSSFRQKRVIGSTIVILVPLSCVTHFLLQCLI